MFRSIRICMTGGILLGLLSADATLAQNLYDGAAPRIDLSIDKAVYRLGEPVVLTVSLTNVSGEPQQYHALRPANSLLVFRPFGPDGNRILQYDHAVRGIAAPGRAPVTPPDTTATAAMMISHYYPLTAEVGVTVLEVGISWGHNRNPFAEGASSIQIQVVPPSKPELVDQVLDPYVRALAAIRGRDGPHSSALDALETVLSSPDPETDYLKEAALFYLALGNQELSDLNDRVPPEYQMDVGARRPLEESIERYKELLNRYPQSNFAGSAQDGISRARRSLTERGSGKHR
jgi:hypothetical protein